MPCEQQSDILSIPTPLVRNEFPSTDSMSSSPSRGRHCGAGDPSLSSLLSTRRGSTRHCSKPAIPRKSWIRHDPVAGGGVCGGRLPAQALSVPSVSLSSLSLPPSPLLPLSSSRRMPSRLPPYILPARQHWQRRSRDARRASTCPSNHRRRKRAGGQGRGGRP